MEYKFGDNESWHTDAKDLEEAINIFKVTVLFPEKYVIEKHRKYDNEEEIEEDEFEEIDKEKQGDIVDWKQYENIEDEYKFNTTNPMIPVFERNMKKDNWKKKPVKMLSLYECINVDMKMFSRVSGLIQAPEEYSKEEYAVIKNEETLKASGKFELRRMMNEIEKRKAALETQKNELVEAKDMLMAELEEKQKWIYVIGTYLGQEEEVYQIAKGKSAPEIEPLYIHQQILYMDEEIGIWEDQGLDFRKINVFDDWIVKNYDKFLYKEKSIVVFQVRRNEKDYNDPIVNIVFGEENSKTYFLIRNGTNLYRIWSDVFIPDRLFPKSDEYEKIVKQGFGSEEWKKDKLKKQHEKYMYGLIAIQGLIDRTEILGTEMQNRVNLMKGKFNNMIRLIRDAEQDHWISDGKLRWRDFLEKNQKTIKQGSRIIIIDMPNFLWKTTRDSMISYVHERTWPFKPNKSPTQMAVYVVEEFCGIEEKYYRAYNLKFLYNPKDIIYSQNYRDDHKRKHRVPYWMYLSEAINFDEITIEDCEYYLKNRIERPQYLTILPVLFYVRKCKLKEQKLDGEFVKFMAGQLNWTEDKYSKIQKAVDWWKLKNKWKRNIMTDDAKAVRMIKKRLLRGNKT